MSPHLLTIIAQINPQHTFISIKRLFVGQSAPAVSSSFIHRLWYFIHTEVYPHYFPIQRTTRMTINTLFHVQSKQRRLIVSFHCVRFASVVSYWGWVWIRHLPKVCGVESILPSIQLLKIKETCPQHGGPQVSCWLPRCSVWSGIHTLIVSRAYLRPLTRKRICPKGFLKLSRHSTM